MSCCVKSSFLRSLAEQKGQKSMLIKGCGQLLACGFALIKTKCSCSRKTLQIYSSNSAHWLWGEPVGFGPYRALTKKNIFLQRYEVCVFYICLCVLCECLQAVLVATPWAFFYFSTFYQEHLRVIAACHCWPGAGPRVIPPCWTFH